MFFNGAVPTGIRFQTTKKGQTSATAAVRRETFVFLLNHLMRSSIPNGRDDSVYMMHYFFLRALLFTLLNVVTLATSTVKPLAGNDNAKNAQCTNVNNYFYAGPNTRKIEQQLAELKEEIKALKRPGNDAGSSRGKGLKTSLRVYFHLVSSC